MKKGIVFIAPHGARNKKIAVFEEIVSQCPGSDYSSVLYITPSTFSQAETRRQFFSYLKTRHQKKVYIPFQSFTLASFCTNLFETHGREDIVSDRAAPMILCEILDEKSIGYARLLSDLLGSIRHYIVEKDLSQIKEDIRTLIFEEKTARQAEKAIGLIKAYENKLQEKGLIDFEHAVKKSLSFIEKFENPSVLVLDDFFDPTPLEVAVLETLIKKSETAYVLVEESAEFSKHFESCSAGIEKKRLKPSYRRKIAGYFLYPSMEDEVEGIARGVKARILEGVRPCEIVVSFPEFQKYLPMLKRVFQKHGIPIDIAEYDISHTKPFIALEEMVTCIEDDYPRNEFLSFLTSPHFPGIPKILKEWAAFFSNRAGIVKGRQAWLSTKATVLNSTDEEIFKEVMKALDDFQRGINNIIHTLDKLKEAHNLPLFVDELETVLDSLGFFDSFEEPMPFSYNHDVSKGIEGLFSELRHFAGLFCSDTTGVDRAGYYLRHLFTCLKGRDENINGVRVVPFELAVILESRALFFGGMIEGDLPSRPGIDPLLPENVKKALGIPFLEYYLRRQKRYFERLIHASSDDPYFSCPAAEGDKVFLPSPFLDWELKLLPPELNIFTEEEILVRKGAFKQREFSQVLWDGKLSLDRHVRKILMNKFGPKKFFSVTRLDAYRQCPLRFYIEKFLCLEIEKPPAFEVEARLWGRLAHKIMEYLVKDKSAALETLNERLFQALEKSLSEFPIGDFWSSIAQEIFLRLLPMLIEQETEIRIQGFRPYMVEKTLKATVHRLKLKGKIDRIDRRTSNFEPRTPHAVILLDYKTGSFNKDSLQLPLYACMWQEEYSDPVEKTGFYSLKSGSVDWHPKKSSMEAFIQDALKDAERIVQEIRKGIFIPSPSKDTECRYCYHADLCKAAK